MNETEYRVALYARIRQIDPTYVWTQADQLDAERMFAQSVDLDRAAESFVRARDSRPNLKRAIG